MKIVYSTKYKKGKGGEGKRTFPEPLLWTGCIPIKKLYDAVTEKWTGFM